MVCILSLHIGILPLDVKPDCNVSIDYRRVLMDYGCRRYKGDKAIVGFASYMVTAGLIDIHQFIMMLSKVNDLQIRQPSWLSPQVRAVLTYHSEN
jgi:hypothetical protein